MKSNIQNSTFGWLIKTYFSDSANVIRIKKGELLIRQGQFNDKLYLVLKGLLQGYKESEGNKRQVILQARTNSFVGVYSFFSGSYRSSATIEALSDCDLAFINSAQPVIPAEAGNCLEKQFMPVIMADLLQRQHQLQKLYTEKESAVNKLLEQERMAALGQMAAGIAHEINNALAVLARGTHWLLEKVSGQWHEPRTSVVFENGLLRGRSFSSREVRQRKQNIMDTFHLPETEAGLLAQAGMTDELLADKGSELQTQAREMYDAWELGSTFHDMLVASEQATHVVKSMKALGAQQNQRFPGLDVNNSLKNSLSLLHHKLKGIQVNSDFGELPAITGQMGELVQVWMNLIKNACEALGQITDRQPELSISSAIENESIRIIVEDNGPGIPKKILPVIFQPNVTTKVDGLSFGLGLGLSIVQRIINEYQGTISVQSSNKGTRFTIYLPVGGEHVKN